MKIESRYPESAFSLVEVTLAMGIAAFCLIAVFGLLPVGLMSNQNSLEQTAASSLVSAISADLSSVPSAISGLGSSLSPVFQIELPSATASAQTIRHVFCAEDGSPTSAGAANARYLVSVAALPPGTGRRGATMIRILVTWPAAANANVQSDQWPAQWSGVYEALTALNRN
jgi:hypothetical protein